MTRQSSIGHVNYIKSFYIICFCDGEINAVVEGSKFRESHVLKILS
jgi:hypothetical protein